ncbi:hypothetical protein GCM10010174_27310 [Kutzneria viridogrisea]|uniref:Uncharacterized protein n=2 Tax=Kutzneria TaxID=43356 RepID=W5WGE9_9PSEU|nr:hypothetical protein [Kutzneria albida]AHH97234.1 hypothetical protein KALB_3870 [Kutzneria albida DSM 43870]MBA8930852.1 hypothetical protein [Kutzneria viridogrisea]
MSDHRRPRAALADLAWRELGPGLEPLSGPGGAPLTRTVKLILVPLVIRPSLRPELAGDLLDPEQAARFGELIAQAGPRLRATASWFTVFKRARRAMGIVAGNPQDLYFQRCYELAAEHGQPPAHAAELAKEVLRELAESVGGRTVEALRQHLGDLERQAELDGELAERWARRRRPAGAVTAAIELAVQVLDGADTYEQMVDAECGSAVGSALWTDANLPWGNEGVPSHLGLTAEPTPPRPLVGDGASTAAMPAPLDRTLFERVFVELQASSARREELPEVPQLVRSEVGRSCAPFGLDGESLRVVMVLGGGLAAGLDPLGSGTAAPTATHRAVNRRWQREASALRARRMTTSPDPAGGQLAVLAEELRSPWAAYTRRLWVRLHGRDVRADPVTDREQAREVLDGVARSVMMDHRAKVRSALRALAGGA